MLLIRHNCIKPPYHDYEALSIEQLDALATDKVAPDIADLPEVLPFDATVLKQADLFVCSLSNRTHQTCLTLQQRFNFTKPVKRDAALNEMYFVPSQLERKEGEGPLVAVRRNLYTSIAAASPAVETAASLQARMDKVLDEYTGQNVVLFTHGFYIRLLQSYAAHSRDMAAALTAIENFPAVGYLELRRL